MRNILAVWAWLHLIICVIKKSDALQYKMHELFGTLCRKHQDLLSTLQNYKAIQNIEPQILLKYYIIANKCHFTFIVFRKGDIIHKIHIYKALNADTNKLFCQDEQVVVMSQTEKTVFSEENTPFTCVCWSSNDEPWSETRCVAEVNRAAYRDFSNKANANRNALIFIYDYTVIYAFVNGGGHQLVIIW